MMHAAQLGMALAAAMAAGDPSDGGQETPAPPPATIWEYLRTKYDANGDGRISRREYDRDKARWKRLDRDGDGYVTEEEAEHLKREPAKGKKRKPPKEGQRAPDFRLSVVATRDATAPEKPTEWKLSSFRGERPVALVFGSYT